MLTVIITFRFISKFNAFYSPCTDILSLLAVAIPYMQCFCSVETNKASSCRVRRVMAYCVAASAAADEGYRWQVSSQPEMTHIVCSGKCTMVALRFATAGALRSPRAGVSPASDQGFSPCVRGR